MSFDEYKNSQKCYFFCSEFQKNNNNLKKNKSIRSYGGFRTHTAGKPATRIFSKTGLIGPNSHEKLTKSEIRPSSSRFEHCSESLI